MHQNYATAVYMPVRLHMFHEEWIVKGKQMALKPQVAAKTEDTKTVTKTKISQTTGAIVAFIQSMDTAELSNLQSAPTRVVSLLQNQSNGAIPCLCAYAKPLPCSPALSL
ncbi:hypothetical protein ACE6H2_005379 [Prunus campanulata]